MGKESELRLKIGEIEMEPFIRVDQFNFIARQAQDLVNGHSTSNEKAVLGALESMARERVLALIPAITEEQAQLLQPITLVDDKDKAERFLSQLKPYVIPFQVTEQGIKKLFPKVKKLKIPALQELDLQQLCYLSWIDYSTNKKFIVLKHNGKLTGLHGSFEMIKQKGICSICHKHEEVGLFLAHKKGKVQGTFTKKGNYICRDNETCNQNITSLDYLHDFVHRLKA
ncbi:Fibronectin-binding protein (FBP) [Oceanobacillus picturae]|uniref:Fibronectin-binding protein (FBP) n=2 Tax=Oceanobacillus picturae TaxID=171693 RepID=W9AGY0_9BACI|nr:Fibronectin-binding protein (FBP) [Oceanobacillus picturae]